MVTSQLRVLTYSSKKIGLRPRNFPDVVNPLVLRTVILKPVHQGHSETSELTNAGAWLRLLEQTAEEEEGEEAELRHIRSGSLEHQEATARLQSDDMNW